MRMTKNRKSILAVLKETRQPISAELIKQTLPKETMDLSTIYRSLEILYEQGLIAKSTVEGTSYYQLNKSDHHHFIVCLNCKKKVELDCSLDQEIHKVADQSNFKVVQHDLTFYGYCPDCKKLKL